MTPSRQDFTRLDLAVLAAVIGIIIVIAVPGVLRSRMARNEAAAMGMLRALVAAEVAYAGACGQNRYATSLATLATPPPGSAQGFLPPGLSAEAPRTRGYRYALKPALGAVAGPRDCHGLETASGYYASAEPERFWQTGARSFAVDTAGTIWQAPAAAAPLEPFAAPASPIQ
jgi:type II secretory pathway pseudopilin PulG